MKNKNLSKFTAIVLLITILTLIVIASTYAKYTSSFTGSGSATAADWSVEISGDGSTFAQSFTLTASDAVYPGGSGTLGTITVKNTSSLVAAKIVAVEITPGTEPGTDVPTNLALSADYADAIEIAPNGTDTFDIKYDWTYTDDDETSYADQSMTFTVAVTVDQVVPTAVP